jgi:NTP pyrophosphatase (non-canonical NTP hydrolase)
MSPYIDTDYDWKIDFYRTWRRRYTAVLILFIVIGAIPFIFYFEEFISRSYDIMTGILLAYLSGTILYPIWDYYWKELEAKRENRASNIYRHLATELNQLRDLFQRRWPDYGDSWKEAKFHFMTQRLHGEVKELMDAVANEEEVGDEKRWLRIRDEALDVTLVSLMLANIANTRLDRFNTVFVVDEEAESSGAGDVDE